MIGTPSLLLELAFPLFLTCMFGVILVEAVRRRDPRGGVGALIAFAVAALVGTRLYYQVQSRRFLQTLRAEDVQRICIGERRITRAEQIAAVVAALNGADWFSANHGGWGERQWLVVDPKSGARRLFLVANHHRAEGAVIEFGRPASGGGFRDGYAFCPSLPSTLASLGAPLEANGRQAAGTETRGSIR